MHSYTSKNNKVWQWQRHDCSVTSLFVLSHAFFYIIAICLPSTRCPWTSIIPQVTCNNLSPTPPRGSSHFLLCASLSPFSSVFLPVTWESISPHHLQNSFLKFVTTMAERGEGMPAHSHIPLYLSNTAAVELKARKVFVGVLRLLFT